MTASTGTTRQTTATSKQKSVGLRAQALSGIETLAQSVATVAPSAMPAMTISIVFGMCGNGTWFAYLMATVAVLFTAYNINIFAQRSATSGSLYSYATMGCGQFVGTLCGWSLLAAYCLCSVACPIQFAIFAQSLFDTFLGTKVDFLPLAIGCIVASTAVAYRNIKLSAEVMLWLEIGSMAVILLLCGMALQLNGGPLDWAQLKLSGMTGEGFRLAFVLALFAIVGFESSATLGVEAEGALKSVPKALINCALISGGFFIFTAYAIVHGFSDAPASLAKCETPLLALAQKLNAPFLGTLTVIGAALSFFGCCLAAVNTGARLLFTMAQDKQFPAFLGQVHPTNQTPHIAIFTVSIIELFSTSAFLMARQPAVEIVGWAATFATYGFVFAYVTISIAAPIYLHKLNQLKKRDIVFAIASALLMGGSFFLSLYPVPAAPYCWIPYIFLAYIAIGALWFSRLRKVRK